MRILYNRLSCKNPFKYMVNRIPYILSIWDDHDYGQNDGGADYPMKQKSQNIFLDFWRIHPNSTRRRQEGVYGAYKFSEGNTSLLIIMLDLRSFRDPLQTCERKTGWYCPTNGTMLGVAQWEWLETTLQNDNSSMVIIASSTQFGADEYGYETWRNMPLERSRLATLLNKNKTVIISGDLHWGEISLTEEGIYDITSSGISQLDPEILPNKYRVGEPIAEYNYGVIDLATMTARVVGASGMEIAVKLPLSHPFK
jgi:alkaline phosphatase D